MARLIKYCLLCNSYGNGKEEKKDTEAIGKYFLKKEGLSPAQIVREKYPKAWSQKHNGIYSIYTGQDKNPKDTPYRPCWATPHGWKIGEGQKLKQAWRSAAQSCI